MPAMECNISLDAINVRLPIDLALRDQRNFVIDPVMHQQPL